MWCCRALTLPRAAGRALMSQARPAVVPQAVSRHTTPAGIAHCCHYHPHPSAAARSAKHRPVRWSAAPRVHSIPVHTSPPPPSRRLWATSHRRVTELSSVHGETPAAAVHRWQSSHHNKKLGGGRGYHSRWAVSVYGKEPGLPDEVGPGLAVSYIPTRQAGKCPRLDLLTRSEQHLLTFVRWKVGLPLCAIA